MYLGWWGCKCLVSTVLAHSHAYSACVSGHWLVFAHLTSLPSMDGTVAAMAAVECRSERGGLEGDEVYDSGALYPLADTLRHSQCHELGAHAVRPARPRPRHGSLSWTMERYVEYNRKGEESVKRRCRKSVGVV
ncbi:hypothetical protein B0H11DRAFT_1339434 [Mycena galericulata]|nr:hypothetical protein B0H11DRAFT_1339434 [Mycena galericulata]